MNYFVIPKVNLYIYNNINFSIDETTEECYISNSLYNYLLNIKSLIEDNNNWDNIKKYTNPYEYINSIIPKQKYSVCNYKPISRSYFKMIEIIKTFNLLETFPLATPFNSFHLAEGPGGFIEATSNMRRNPNDIYIGMTLIDDKNEDIPGWRKSKDFLLKTPNVFLEKGIDDTGNILNIENLKYCYKKYGSTMNFITGDGGFDFTMNFNEQEKNMVSLLFAQMCYALLLQKYGGTFILKIFDCFTIGTIDIIYILSAFYENVYIIKPQTSRYANSERYIVCKGFLFYSTYFFLDNIINTFQKMLDNIDKKKRFININIPVFFIKKIEECNAFFGQQQLENIHTTINLIDNKNKNDKIENLKKINIQKCIQWCIKYDLSYNNITSLKSHI